MDHPSQELFSLNIDPVTKSYLSDTAKWARFLAITGMIFLAIIAAFAIFGTALTPTSFTSPDVYNDQAAGVMRVTMVVVSIIVIAIGFFPLMYLLQFSGRMKRALLANDQEYLNSAFLNLKKYFRFFGIMVIISLAFYILIFVFLLIGFAAR